jgi:hypothetical protein
VWQANVRTVGASGAANHPGETSTFAERLFDVKENIERVFAPNV